MIVVIFQFWAQKNKLFAVARPALRLHEQKKKAKILFETVIKFLVETVIKKISAVSGNIESIYQKVRNFCPSINDSLDKTGVGLVFDYVTYE